MRQNKIRKNLCVCALLIVTSLFTTSIVSAKDSGREKYRKDLLKGTFHLLDKIENQYPKAQADIVKVREKVMRIYQTPKMIAPTEKAPDYSLDSSSSRESWKDFYESVSNYSDGELMHKLREKMRKQKGLKYSDARRHIMLKVDNDNGYIECVYTGRVIQGKHMPKATNMNIEHSWPQSHGAKGIAKSDLHHLFPTDSKANSIRGSLYFNFVSNPTWEVGGSKCDKRNFEVRKKYRGNIARAQFYFATRYNMKIRDNVERVLRQWHKTDPVDAKEKARNDKVEAIQNNRNPFIDHPEFVNKISNF